MLIEPHDGLELLGKLMKTTTPQVAVMNVQWGDMLKLRLTPPATTC